MEQTQSKFKVGDRVVRVKDFDQCFTATTKGEALTITDIDLLDGYDLSFGVVGEWWKAENYKLYNEGETMKDQNDYSLLRPFNLEAVEEGEGILWFKEVVRWVGLTEHKQKAHNIIEHQGGLAYAEDDELKMQPMAWVEGKPVYRGDKLQLNGKEVTAWEYDAENSAIRCRRSDIWLHISRFSWDKPKVKRSGWVNIYKDDVPTEGISRESAGIYETKEEADKGAALGLRIDCVKIEWEE